MTQLMTGLILFFAVHSIAIVNDAWRDSMAAELGEWTWKGLYALVAAIGLLLIVGGYEPARQALPMPLYEPATWLQPLALALLVPVFPLLLATYLPGRIRSVTRHPMLLATQLWAAAHLLTNGTLADLLLFGSFFVWATVDRISLGRRRPRPVPSAPASRYNDAISISLGLALYAAFALGLHGWLFGVPVLSR